MAPNMAADQIDLDRSPRNIDEVPQVITDISSTTLRVSASDRRSMVRQLDEAEEAIRANAIREGCRGILVTREGPGVFTVTLSSDVPFGITREHSY